MVRSMPRYAVPATMAGSPQNVPTSTGVRLEQHMHPVHHHPTRPPSAPAAAAVTVPPPLQASRQQLLSMGEYTHFNFDNQRSGHHSYGKSEVQEDHHQLRLKPRGGSFLRRYFPIYNIISHSSILFPALSRLKDAHLVQLLLCLVHSFALFDGCFRSLPGHQYWGNSALSNSTQLW